MARKSMVLLYGASRLGLEFKIKKKQKTVFSDVSNHV